MNEMIVTNPYMAYQWRKEKPLDNGADEWEDIGFDEAAARCRPTELLKAMDLAWAGAPDTFDVFCEDKADGYVRVFVVC